MEGVGWGLEEGVTHACNCAAVEYVKAVLASDGSVGGSQMSEEGPLLGKYVQCAHAGYLARN